MKRLTIYDIKRMTAETEPRFFSKNNLKHSGQTMKDFKVYKKNETEYFITAPIRVRDMVIGRTEFFFNTTTKELTSK